MSEEVYVETSGITLSALLFENERSSLNDQYGLLLGCLSENVTKTVTDRDIENVKINKYINISGVFPLYDIFFDNIGQIDQEKIDDYVRNEKNIIGWYHSRRNTDLQLTLREKLIHKGLCNIIDTPVDMFVFCVLTSSYTANFSKHTYSQIFYRYNYSQFIEVPLHIANLGDSNKMYKNTSRKHHSQSTVDKIVSNIKASVDSSQSMYLINKLEEGIQSYIKNQITQVSRLVEELNSLEQEIQNSKQQKTDKDLTKSPDQLGSNDSLNEILIKTNDIKDKLVNTNSSYRFRNRTVNKETKRALNVQLKMIPDGATTKEKSDVKTRSKSNTPEHPSKESKTSTPIQTREGRTPIQTREGRTPTLKLKKYDEHEKD